MLKKRFFEIFLILILALPTWAGGPHQSGRVMSFKQWKDGQILQATNSHIRASNKVKLLSGASTLVASEVRLSALKDLERASKSVEMTKSLSLEDYFVVYLRELDYGPSLLREAAKMLSEDEVTELMRLMIRSQQESSSQKGAMLLPKLTNPGRKI